MELSWCRVRSYAHPRKAPAQLPRAQTSKRSRTEPPAWDNTIFIISETRTPPNQAISEQPWMQWCYVTCSDFGIAWSSGVRDLDQATDLQLISSG